MKPFCGNQPLKGPFKGAQNKNVVLETYSVLRLFMEQDSAKNNTQQHRTDSLLFISVAL